MGAFSYDFTVIEHENLVSMNNRADTLCHDNNGGTLCNLCFPSALAILLVRCTLGALFAGNASALLFSLLGGLSALLVMALLSGAKKLSIFGVSIAGAAAHNCGQVCAALITLGSTAPLYYLPFLLLVSLFTGALSGLITAFLFRVMAHTPYGTKGENQHG